MLISRLNKLFVVLRKRLVKECIYSCISAKCLCVCVCVCVYVSQLNIYNKMYSLYGNERQNKAVLISFTT